MIKTFYGEHGSPDGAAQDAHNHFEEWRNVYSTATILKISTAACGSYAAECFHFWLTIDWDYQGDGMQEVRIEGLATAASIVLHELNHDGVQQHTRDLLAAALNAYETGKGAQDGLHPKNLAGELAPEGNEALRVLAEVLSAGDIGMDSNCVCTYCHAVLTETLHEPECPIRRGREILAGVPRTTTPEEAGRQAERAMQIAQKFQGMFGEGDRQ